MTMPPAQIHFLPILTKEQRKSKREVELVAASARSHAAKVSHLRLRSTQGVLNSSQQGLRNVKSRSKADKRSQDESTTDVSDYNAHSPSPPIPSPPMFKGNSDPFSGFDFGITAELNSVITFTRESGVPSMFNPLFFRLASNVYPEINFDKLGKAQRDQFLSSIYASFSDEGTALARLILYGNIMCKTVNDAPNLKLLTLQMRARSLKLLEDKIAKLDTTSESQTENLRQHIFGLLHAHALEGDISGSRVHAVALRKLLNPKSVDVVTMNNMLHISVSAAMSSGQRTLSDIDDWCLIPLMTFLAKFRDTIWGSCTSPDIDCSVTLPILRQIFEQRWHSLTNTLPPRHIWSFLYCSIATNVDFCLLNNLYFDLMDGKVMTESSTCERMTQAALAVALLYLHRRLHGDITIAGMDRNDVSQILMASLQKSLRLALKFSNTDDRILYQEAWLWVSYVGALYEHQQGRKIKRQTFTPILVSLAQSVDITSWSEMQSIAERFFYFALIDPEQTQWFEALLAEHNPDDGPQSEENKAAFFPNPILPYSNFFR